jgi:hypothetical protein
LKRGRFCGRGIKFSKLSINMQEYLDSPLADDKDDAANLRIAITRATTKRRSKPYDRPAERANISEKFASRGGAKFNARNFFRGFSQFNGDGSLGQQQFVGKCFYCKSTRTLR